MEISIKRISKICLMVVNQFGVLLLLGVKNEKLGIRLDKIHAGKKKTKFS